jgi:hypothetical protein
VFDGYSFLLFIERLAQIYSALKSGSQPAAASWSSLTDLLADDEAYRGSSAFQKDQHFWGEYLADCAEPPILAGDVQNASPEVSTVKAKIMIAPETAASLRQTAQQNGTSWSQFITAAMAAYLARVSGQPDEVVLGMPVTARVGRTAKNVPAMMSNVLPLRVPVARFGSKPARIASSTLSDQGYPARSGTPRYRSAIVRADREYHARLQQCNRLHGL